ncbi:MAG: hypothetical protein EBV06_14375, partial [Planctomycetia bacterium]|nr:hypothetical protein [Planctomycetia bacterium]
YINDRLKMFSPSAIRSATEKIAKLKELYDHELRIETLPDQLRMLDLQGVLYRRIREDRLRSWIRERAASSGMGHGLYIVITKNPPDIRIAGWPSETEERFLWSHRDELRASMRRHLRSNPDLALQDTLNHFADLLNETRSAPSPLATLGLCTVIGVSCLLWVVLCLVRRHILGKTASIYPPAVQGGLFGTPAAWWIYDRLFLNDKVRFDNASNQMKEAIHP